MYLAAAERQGVDIPKLNGTLQTDIFKEYIAQKEWLFQPEPHLRLIGDLMEYCAQGIPAYKPLSVSGYHIREAGSTAAQELAFTLADGFGYVELGPVAAAWTSTPSRPACRSSSTRTSTSSRRSPSSAPPAGSGPAGCATCTAPRPTRHSGCASTPRPPASRSPPSSRTTTSSAPPSRRSPRSSAAPTPCTPTRSTRPCAAQRPGRRDRAAHPAVLMEEIGVTNVADPLGGSWYVEALTDRIEAEAEKIFYRIKELGAKAVPSGRHPIGVGVVLKDRNRGRKVGEPVAAVGATLDAGIHHPQHHRPGPAIRRSSPARRP